MHDYPNLTSSPGETAVIEINFTWAICTWPLAFLNRISLRLPCAKQLKRQFKEKVYDSMMVEVAGTWFIFVLEEAVPPNYRLPTGAIAHHSVLSRQLYTDDRKARTVWRRSIVQLCLISGEWPWTGLVQRTCTALPSNSLAGSSRARRLLGELYQNDPSLEYDVTVNRVWFDGMDRISGVHLPIGTRTNIVTSKFYQAAAEKHSGRANNTPTRTNYGLTPAKTLHNRWTTFIVHSINKSRWVRCEWWLVLCVSVISKTKTSPLQYFPSLLLPSHFPSWHQSCTDVFSTHLYRILFYHGPLILWSNAS
jgi:hypothetical protein